jgi:hypothetical protein
VSNAQLRLDARADAGRFATPTERRGSSKADAHLLRFADASLPQRLALMGPARKLVDLPRSLTLQVLDEELDHRVAPAVELGGAHMTIPSPIHPAATVC